MIEKVIKYLSIISPGVFLLGYAYLNGYYSSFHVNIINYISTSEIFYALLPLVVFVFSSGYAFFQGYISPGGKRSPTPAGEVPGKQKGFKKNWIFFFIGILAMIGGFINSKHFTYRDAPLVQSLCTTVFIIGIGYPALKDQLKNIGQFAFLQLVCFAVMGYLFVQFGQEKARINRVLGNETKIRFKYHSALYNTSDKLIYLGETQSTLLLYLKSDSVTWVLPKINIDSLLVLDN